MRYYSARAVGAEGGLAVVPVGVSAVAQGVLAPLTNSGVLSVSAVDSYGLTRTTPTLTPTTLRNIEDAFMAEQLDNVASTSRDAFVTPPVQHHHQAGFVTPQVSGVTYSQLDARRWQGGSATVNHHSRDGRSPPGLVEVMPRLVPQAGHRRGGRRPKDDDVPPEERQRRLMRRERNKQAAARCRRRRMDLTNTLQMETEDLEEERRGLERQIQQLQAQREELAFIMDSHRGACRLGKENRVQVKAEPTEASPQPYTPPGFKQEPSTPPQPQFQPPQPPPRRPTSLSVNPFASGLPSTSLNLTNSLGVPLSTPSQGLGLNFDSLMEGGTGLTPVTSSTMMPLLPGGSLATPVVTTAESRRVEMLSPDAGRNLVSL